MGFWTSYVAPALSATYLPTDNFWYQRDPRYAAATNAGITATPEQAMRLGAVYACVRIITDKVGWVPLHIYRRREDGGKDRAIDDPTYALLRRRPNQYQTAIRWRQLGMRHILLRGNFYNLKVESTRRIQELIPLDPDRMTVKLLSSGRRGYLYRPAGQEPVTFTQDEIFHVMGFTLDGVTGCSVIEYASESASRSLAEERQASRFYSQGMASKGALVTDGKLTKEQREANSEAWQESQSGWWNSHKTAMLEGGLKWMQIGVSARDAQYLEGRSFSRSDIAMFFGVPPHKIGDVDRSTSWGTGIAEQSIGFLDDTMQAWYTLWEQEIDRQLLYDDDDLFAEFLTRAMVRSSPTDEATLYRQYVDGGILSVNEVRDQLNLNPIEGEEFDKPQRAQNIGGGGNPATSTGQRKAPPGGDGTPPPDNTQADRANDIVLRAATRTVAREIAAIVKWAPRYAGQPLGWREWVAQFYGSHVTVLQEALGLDETQARQYGAAHTAALIERGVSICEEWDRHAPAALTALALGEEIHA